MRVLITGGAGFIGHHTAIYLSKKGFEVVVLDNLSRARKDSLLLLKRNGIRVIVGDLLGERLPKTLAEVRPEAVVHAAALISVEESFEKPLLYNKVNVEGTLRLLDELLKLDSVEYFIYLSSAAVYGDPKYLPIDEEHPTEPLSPYGASKLAAEHYVKVYSNLGLKAAILRLFNVYGPRQNLEYAGVIAKFVNRIRRGKPPVIFGDGKQTRDFIHVQDVVEAIQRALERRIEGVFNLAYGKPASVLELAEMLLRITKRDLKPIFKPPRPGDVRHSYANVEKMAKALAWKPKISLEDGLRMLLEEEV